MFTNIHNKNLISSVELLDNPEIYMEAIKEVNDEASIMDILEITGNKVVSNQPEYNTHIAKSVFKKATATTVAGTTVTVAAEDLPIERQQIYFSSGAHAIVESLDSATTFTIRILSGTPASGDVMSYFSTAMTEGSDDPAAEKSAWELTKNNVQIIGTSGSITNLQKPSVMEINVGGSPYLFYKIQHDTLLRHRGRIATSLLMGKQSKKVESDGNLTYTTQGLREYCKGGDGQKLTTGAVELDLAGGSIDATKLRTFFRALDKKQSPKEALGWFGGDLRADFEEMVRNWNGVSNGGLRYNYWGGSSEAQKAIDLGIKTLSLNGRTIHLSTVEAFDHEDLFGDVAFGLDKEGFVIPVGKVKTDYGNNAAERLRLRYMAGDGYNGAGYNEEFFGRLAGGQSSKSVLGVSYETMMGLEALGIRQFGYIK